MRGTVTLAAALALPAGFPYRDLILFTAFAVVLGTLVLQGMTLRPIMARLNLEDDGTSEREVRVARVETLRAGLAATAGASGDGSAGLLRHRYEVLLRRAEAELEGADEAPAVPQPTCVDADVVRGATVAERRRLTALREDGTIGDAAFQRVEQELDWGKLDVQQLLRSEQSTD